MDQAAATSMRDAPINQIVGQLSRFAGAPPAFLQTLVEMQCRLVAAQGGAYIQPAGEQTPVLACFPAPASPNQAPPWLGHVVRQLAQSPSPNGIYPLRNSGDMYGQAPQACVVAVPTPEGCQLQGVAVFHLRGRDEQATVDARDRLALSMSLLGQYEARLAAERSAAALKQLQQSGGVLSAVNEHERAVAAAMAFCNETATVCGADRVSLGFLRGRYIKLYAISHTEKFTRKMQLVQDIEAAMDEALDQDLEIIHPAAPESVYVSRAAGQLASRGGSPHVCSLPLRRAGKPVGVVAVQRSGDKPFDATEVELLRLACELCTARLIELCDRDRWFGARLAAGARKLLAKAVGPEHTWVKAAAVGVLAAIIFFAVAKGPDNIDAPFLIEASHRRIVSAPFDGYLDKVNVEPNDKVEAGKTVLAELDRSELELQLAPLEFERAGYLKEAATAMRDGKSADAQIAQAQADRLAAQINLVQYHIAHTQITCPTDGVVLSGDLKQQEGAPVSKGDVLFEVAPLDDLRAVLMVPENRIGDLAEGHEGELATAASPGVYMPFVVERINPMAEVRDGNNVFRVRVRLTGQTANLLPGVEGAAKVKVGRRHYIWLWTRDMVHWVRMKLWI